MQSSSSVKRRITDSDDEHAADDNSDVIEPDHLESEHEDEPASTARPKRMSHERHTVKSNVLKALFVWRDEIVYVCQTSLSYTNVRKGQYSHRKEVTVSAKTKSNLTQHATTWHKLLYDQLVMMDADGASLEAMQRSDITKAVLLRFRRSKPDFARVRPSSEAFRAPRSH